MPRGIYKRKSHARGTMRAPRPTTVDHITAMERREIRRLNAASAANGGVIPPEIIALREKLEEKERECEHLKKREFILQSQVNRLIHCLPKVMN